MAVVAAFALLAAGCGGGGGDAGASDPDPGTGGSQGTNDGRAGGSGGSSSGGGDDASSGTTDPAPSGGPTGPVTTPATGSSGGNADAGAGSDAATTAPSSCTTGIAGTQPFDATPRAGGGNTCFVSNALYPDKSVAGLDATTTSTLDGTCVTSCLGVHFPTPIAGAAIVTAGPTANGCNSQCTGSYCGTGHVMHVFASATVADPLKLVSTVTLTNGDETVMPYKVPLASAAGYVVVCRSCAGAARDDVIVDSIMGACPSSP